MADPSAGFFEGTEKRRTQVMDLLRFRGMPLQNLVSLDPRRIEVDFRGDGSLRNAPRSDWESVVFHTTEPEGSRAGAEAMTKQSGLGAIAEFMAAEACGPPVEASFETNFGSTLKGLPERPLEETLNELLGKAFSWTPGRGHEKLRQELKGIPMRDEMPLMIVASGELYVCIGGGPAATASAGFVIGFVGLFRLHEIAQKNTRSALPSTALAWKSPAKLGTNCVVSVANLIAQREEEEEGSFATKFYFSCECTLQMVRDCIHNLCPHTLGLSKVQWSEKSTVPLRMEMVDALTNQRNILQTDDTLSGFCKLACISLERIYDLFSMTPSLDIFETNQLAETRIEGLRKLLDVLAAFPGLECCLNPTFIRSLANITERKMNFLGDAVQRHPEDCKALELQFQQRFLALADALGLNQLQKAFQRLGIS
eukprot:Skav212398  [mRNA]  locus=scaffold469:24113:47079:- [translate_table: standard]